MAKISALTDGAPAVGATDTIAIARSGANKRLTLSDVKTLVNTSPTFTGAISSTATGMPVTVQRGGIPLIGLSSGSVAANGAISAITALNAVYPHAYCYFPANILATSIAAGWYYCTFSTTTAGVAFLDTYTSGVPTKPTSPTAVTDGKGAFTGDTSEEMGVTVSIPALNATSSIRTDVHYHTNGTANTKTARIRMSGAAGTIFQSSSIGNNPTSGYVGYITNVGSASGQISSVVAVANVIPTTAVAGTVNTGSATTMVFSIQRGTATDNIIILPPTVEVMF